MSLLVFGGAGDLGRAIAGKAVQMGKTVIATTRSSDRLERIPEGVIGLVGDARSSEHSDALICEALTRLKERNAAPLAGVVLANGCTMNKLFLRTSDDDWQDMMETNFMTSMRVVRSTLRLTDMSKQRKGSFVALSSVVSRNGNPGQTVYGASKAALEGAFASLAREYGSRNIQFNTVAPGLIESTHMSSDLPAERRRLWESQVSLQRLGTPDEVAVAVLAVLDMKFVTGQVIRVCGGL